MRHWKNYEPIEDVLVFDERGAGPSIGRMQVVANLHPSEHNPECRVVVGLGGVISGSLTLEQSALLRERLAQAEADVAAALTGASQERSDG